MRPGPAVPETQDGAGAAAREAWRRAKAEADRLYWKLCGDRVNARRRARYRNDKAYRERARACPEDQASRAGISASSTSADVQLRRRPGRSNKMRDVCTREPTTPYRCPRSMLHASLT
jgi:hypothetical protein